jgi:trehalose 6-phosphate phosphatase
VRGGALLAFDFDGTLAPIVADPDRAALRPETRRRLARLALRRPCLVLSGRNPDDLAMRMAGVGPVELIGNHGASFDLKAHEHRAALARAGRWRARLARDLSGRKDVRIEDNGVSLAVHYRGSRERSHALDAIRRAAARLRGACVLGGRSVVNVLPSGFTHKGIVLQTLARRRGLSHLLFAGDDVTDETAFETQVARHFLTIHVGRRARSSADYCLVSQAHIDELLLFLLRCDS